MAEEPHAQEGDLLSEDAEFLRRLAHQIGLRHPSGSKLMTIADILDTPTRDNVDDLLHNYVLSVAELAVMEHKKIIWEIIGVWRTRLRDIVGELEAIKVADDLDKHMGPAAFVSYTRQQQALTLLVKDMVEPGPKEDTQETQQGTGQ